MVEFGQEERKSQCAFVACAQSGPERRLADGCTRVTNIDGLVVYEDLINRCRFAANIGFLAVGESESSAKPFKEFVDGGLVLPDHCIRMGIECVFGRIFVFVELHLF